MTPSLSTRQIVVVFGVVMMGMLLPAFNIMAVTTALPVMVGELGGLADLSWVVTAYLLTATVSVPLYGKVSDLYGRRPLFQAAIVIFIVGSVLAGSAQTMGHLILARGVQGIGGGGLMALSQAIIGDAVPPRDRGKYQGYLGIVFAVASIVGPLAGGFFVDRLSWRWIFFVTVPLGLAALVIAVRYLRIPHERRQHRIDFTGASLLTVAATCVVLVSVWGGVEHEWGSPLILGLAATAVVAVALLIPVERRADEPMIPFELFSSRVFTSGSAVGFIVGTTMFGTFVFVPLFLQAVVGVSATDSGLLLVPLMFGIIVSSITAGRLVTRWGRYKVFPVMGTALSAVGFGLLATMGPDTSPATAAAYLGLLGLSLGMILQIVILAIQNAVHPRHLGVATSTAHFFRMIGGTVGVAAFGALLTARTSRLLAGDLPAGVDLADVLDDPARVGELPGAVQESLRSALSGGVGYVFTLAALVSVVAFAAALSMREVPMGDGDGGGGSQRDAPLGASDQDRTGPTLSP